MGEVEIKTQKPASESWRNLALDSSLSYEELKAGLQNIYRANLPEFAEIVINPECMNRCKHCIYPDDYACHNKPLSAEEWKSIIDELYSKLEFRHFIFGGRGLNTETLEIVRYIKGKYKDCKVGFIAEALGLEKFWKDINEMEIDHLDISVDGLKASHDLQRNREGLFDLTVKMIGKLMADGGPVKTGRIKKLGILSALTSINRNDVLPMMKYFNSKFGVKNFFVTPVNIFAGRPHASLKLSNSEVLKVVREVMGEFDKLEDAYVGFNCYEDNFAWFLKDEARDLHNRLAANGDYFEFGEEGESSEFHFSWYPLAINGCREFMVNTNGDIFTGMVEALGKIPKENIFGNVKNISGNRKEFFEKFVEKPAFDFFVKQMKSEWAKDFIRK